MLNTADSQIRLPSTPAHPVIAVEDLFEANRCQGFSIEPCRGFWSARSGVFPGGRFLICAPTEAFAMRVDPAKKQTLFVVPQHASSLLKQNGWEIPSEGFGISTSDNSFVLHANGPAQFALIWISRPLSKAPDSSKSLIAAAGPERKKISIDSDGQTLAVEIEHLAEELTAFSSNGFQAESNDLLANQPRRLMSRLSVVLDAWDQFENKIDEDFDIPSIARRNDVSSRTLEYAFHEMVGRTPIGFLKQMRLHRARRLILSGKVPTVKNAATQSGMWHFGRFSVDYRIQFGELARVALKASKTNTSDLSRAAA